ncbi:MAG: SRPBCC family protein [Pseudomonadota bacterium]
MAIIEATTVVRAAINDVFATTQNYRIRAHWDPFTDYLGYETSNFEPTVGALLDVRAKSGLRMTVRFVQFRPPTVAAIVMVNGPTLLARFAGSWNFRALAQNETEVRFRYVLAAKWWFFPVIANAVLQRYFLWHTQRRLAGLKRYMESGRCL